MSYCDGDDPSEVAGGFAHWPWLAGTLILGVLLLASNWRP